MIKRFLNHINPYRIWKDYLQGIEETTKDLADGLEVYVRARGEEASSLREQVAAAQEHCRRKDEEVASLTRQVKDAQSLALQLKHELGVYKKRVAEIDHNYAIYKTLAEVVSRGPMPVLVFQPDKARTVAYANEALGEVFGYEPSNIIGRSFMKLFRHTEGLEEKLEKAAVGINFEIDLPRKGKKKLRANLSLYEVERRYFFGVYLREIGSLEQAEEMVARAKEKISGFLGETIDRLTGRREPEPGLGTSKT